MRFRINLRLSGAAGRSLGFRENARRGSLIAAGKIWHGGERSGRLEKKFPFVA
jgi:hypothetical protein